MEGIASLTEDLAGMGAISRRKPVGKAPEGNRTIGFDRLPGIGRAAAQAEIAPLAGAVYGESDAIRRAAGGPVVGIECASAVTCQHAEPKAVVDRRIHAGEEAAGSRRRWRRCRGG